MKNVRKNLGFGRKNKGDLRKNIARNCNSAGFQRVGFSISQRASETKFRKWQ